MKPILLLLLICIYGLTAFGQKVAVANTKENVLWAGLPNPLIVMAEGYSCKDITVTASEGKLEPASDDCSYTIYLEKFGGLTITVSSKKKPVKVLGQMEFRVKRIPPPVAFISGYNSISGANGGSIRKKTGVIAVLENFDYDVRFTVTEYTLTVTRGNNIYFSHHNKGSKFEQTVLDAFTQIVPGDVLDVYDIDCVGPDRDVRRLQSIRLREIE